MGRGFEAEPGAGTGDYSPMENACLSRMHRGMALLPDAADREPPDGRHLRGRVACPHVIQKVITPSRIGFILAEFSN